MRVNHLKNPRLPEGERWAGFGNLFLLDRPERVAVQVSRRASEGAIAALKAKVLVLSAFVYTGRKQVLTRECCLSMNRWVAEMCANNDAPQ